MKRIWVSWIMALVIAFGAVQGAAADAMNTQYGGEPYLTEDGSTVAPAEPFLSRRGKILAAAVLVALAVVIFYWKPRKLKPGSYRFYPSHRVRRRPYSQFRR